MSGWQYSREPLTLYIYKEKAHAACPLGVGRVWPSSARGWLSRRALPSGRPVLARPRFPAECASPGPPAVWAPSVFYSFPDGVLVGVCVCAIIIIIIIIVYLSSLAFVLYSTNDP